MIDLVEYEQRYFNRFYGKRRARVIENQDPERRGRIKVENTELYGVSNSPWVMPCFPFYGGRDCGFFSVPPIGSLVWIECEEGLAEYPIYSGGFFDLTTGGHSSDGSPIENSNEYQEVLSAAPAHARGDLDGSDLGSLKGRYGVPASSFEGDYGEVTILQTKTGHKLEFDDTKGGQRIQIHHANGAHIEMLPDGSINIVTEGSVLTRGTHRREFISDSKLEVVGGNRTQTIEGDATSSVLGSETKTVQGSSSFSADSLSSEFFGDLSVQAGTVKAESTNLFELLSGGDISFNAFGDLDLVTAGRGVFSCSNAVTLPTGLPFVTDSVSISGLNGNVTISSSDVTNSVSYGMMARGGLLAPLGGEVFIGNTSVPQLGVGGVPFLKEPAVMGTQMQLFMEAILSALDGFFLATNTGGVTPGFGGPNPILGAASVVAQSALTVARNAFLTPTPTQPRILSECVYLSKA